MRLIDADKLMQDLADEMLAKALDMLNYDNVEYMIDRLASTPTAFDVDKVVEQLEETREKDIPRINNTTTKRDEKVYKLAMSYAIDIVKAGGIDD